jgi:hypothetical protein
MPLGSHGSTRRRRPARTIESPINDDVNARVAWRFILLLGSRCAGRAFALEHGWTCSFRNSIIPHTTFGRSVNLGGLDAQHKQNRDSGKLIDAKVDCHLAVRGMAWLGTQLESASVPAGFATGSNRSDHLQCRRPGATQNHFPLVVGGADASSVPLRRPLWGRSKTRGRWVGSWQCRERNPRLSFALEGASRCSAGEIRS